MLPAYGKYFNPCRNLQMDYLNSHVRQMYQQCQPYKEGRQRTFDQLQNDLQKASQEITPQMCKNWFKERATGKAYRNFLSSHTIRKISNNLIKRKLILPIISSYLLKIEYTNNKFASLISSSLAPFTDLIITFCPVQNL